jgi:methyltransferase (TIGR00027 family)
MLAGEPSRTAWAAAMHRAAHQVLEDGRVFADPLAVRIVATVPEAIAADARAHPQRRAMRLFIACRHAFAQDVVTAEISRGVAQVVILGAGLDTTAYRPQHVERPPRVFEVDHPATQTWKHAQLAATGIVPSAEVVYVPVDFEHEHFLQALEQRGFRPGEPAVFVWLGVVPYLTREAVEQTLSTIAGLPGGAVVVFDYSEPRPGGPDADADLRHRRRAEHVARLGEPWITFFRPAELHDLLSRAGFTDVEDLGLAGFGPRYLGLPPDTPDRPGGHIVAATAVPAIMIG